MRNNKRKSSSESDQALHESTHGQFGEEPRPEPMPPLSEDSPENHQKDRIRAARKKSRSI
ncbi:MAG: hypothetical protein M3232_04405 [Thermoproteota archaeon]|jgi:hypothetical protein|nr:hypothetical protein [Thermoproteota archaeon]